MAHKKVSHRQAAEQRRRMLRGAVRRAEKSGNQLDITWAHAQYEAHSPSRCIACDLNGVYPAHVSPAPHTCGGDWDHSLGANGNGTQNAPDPADHPAYRLTHRNYPGGDAA